MERMLTTLAGGCENGTCPAVHAIAGDSETLIVQGAKVTDPRVRAALGLPPGEDAVLLPKKVLLDAAREAGA